MGITIYDVAAGAQVSPATVSRVLAGGNSVAPETAERVRTVIERLGYRPDRVAQSLRRQRSGTIGLVISVDAHPASSAIIDRLSRRLAEAELSLFLGTTGHEPFGAVVDRLIAQRVDGLILVRGRPTVDLPASDGAEIPILALDCGHGELHHDSVRVDHAAGIRQAVRFLVKEGARRLAYIGEGTASVIGAEQLDGYAAATAELETQQAALRLGPASAHFANSELQRLLAGDDPPDAYVCGSDVVAAAINAALPVELGEERPLIVGYGAMPWVSLMRPALTTVRLPIEELVDEAVRVLQQRLGGLRSDPVDIALPPSLILGETS
ncbi:MAG: LacI family DNA-binding transcriptional regulator [Actinomycetota bacterium]